MVDIHFRFGIRLAFIQYGKKRHDVDAWPPETRFRGFVKEPCLTVAAERQEPAAHTIITVAKPETGQLPVLVNWFYPGRDIRNRFVYSKQTEKELGQWIVASNQARSSKSGTAGSVD